MPLYQFECPACGHRETVLLSMGDRDNIRIVPRCMTGHPTHPFRSRVVMVRVQTPVAGIVRNPAVPRRR